MMGAVLDSVLMETVDDKAMLEPPTVPAPVIVLGDTETAETSDASAHLVGDGRPDPQWVRGRCPECGDDLISNMYFTPGCGYIIRWECWSSRGETPQCGYQRVL